MIKKCFCKGDRSLSKICSECYSRNYEAEDNIKKFKEQISNIKKILNKKYRTKDGTRPYWNENNYYKNLTYDQYSIRLGKVYSKLDAYLECKELFEKHYAKLNKDVQK